jgi:hypothetical protein
MEADGNAPSPAPGAYAARCRGQRVALLTQHGKEQLLGPPLASLLGCTVQRVDGFDTDTLGTFTRDVERAGSQLDAARRKARIGMERSGLPLGLASEGAFGPDPLTGVLPWDIELVIWIDDERGLEVVGMAQGPARSAHASVRDWPEVEAFAARAGFPDHHLVIRPEHADHPDVIKGLADWAALRAAFDRARARSGNGLVFVENDLRAHTNPTRQALIRQAGLDLARRLCSDCPACGRPGFWVSAPVPGLPCARCGLPTREPVRLRWHCAGCGHTEDRPRPGPTHADPSRCAHCNP